MGSVESSIGGSRVEFTVDRLIVLGVVISLVIAACAVLDDSSNPPAADVPITIASTPTTPIASTSTFTTTTTTTTMTTTVAPTTTIAPTVEVVIDVCESLRSDGFETRRVAAGALAEAFTAAGGAGDGRAEAAAECGEELDRLDGALEIRDRMQTIDIAEEHELYAVSLTDFSCGPGTFEVTATNDTAAPLGLHANFAMYIYGNRDKALQSSFTPIVIWSIEPGASEVISGQFADSPQSQIYCDLDGQVFDADQTSVDASLGAEPEYPALTGDDPAAWFPALMEVQSAARSSGEIDLAAVTDDVRSMSYDEAALAISEGEVLPETDIVEVCERGRSQPDADHIGVVYLERFAAGDTRLSHGLFRRGADGQWRSLSSARYYESTISADCSGVDPEF
jgi:hypothetical protein